MASHPRIRSEMFLAAVIAWGLVAIGALAQETPVGTDPIVEAIQNLKAAADPDKAAERGFRMDFSRAQRTLIENPQKALPHLVKMLKTENVTQHRINAAIVLAEIAASVAQPSAEMVEAWNLCLKDSSDAVAYWGLAAMMEAKVGDEEKKAAIAECLKLSRSRILRIAAAEAAYSAGFKPAVPLLIQHMQQLLQPYRDQIKSVLTRPVEAERYMERGMPGEGYPGPEIGPGRAPGVRPTTRPGAPSRPRAPALGVPTTPRTRSAPSARPGTRPGLPAGRTTRPGVAVPEGEEGMAPVVRYEVINPDELQYHDIEALLPALQALPVYEEMHLVGIWCETLVITGPTDPGFGFRSAPPWALDKCVEAAVAWLQEKGQASRK